MKVLIVFREEKNDNAFVETLYNGIKKQGVDIECSISKFWSATHLTYDIIHFQWPEEVVGWNCNDLNIVLQLEEKINFLKSGGTKFIYTRHNTAPHYLNKIINKAYKIIESSSDIIVHMANCSLNNFSKEYPSSQNIVIPHHIYESVYNENIKKEEARKILNIEKDHFVITSFGKFRNSEERKMVLKAFWGLKIKKKLLLAPRIYPFQKKPKHANVLKRIISYIGYYWIIPLLKYFNIRGGSAEEIILDEYLPYYLIAADIVLIQRKSILNSGNVPLGFLFKKVVIGPCTGNVGEILHATGNPTFNPNNNNSIISAIQQAYNLSINKHGEKNYIYAKEELNISKISKKYIDAYNSLVE